MPTPIVHKAFTTRIPLAVLILLGIKTCENRSHLPVPSKGKCGMSCSKSSDEREYENFLRWCKKVFTEKVLSAIPSWDEVKDWRGKMVAVMDYDASMEQGDAIWDEGV